MSKQKHKEQKLDTSTLSVTWTNWKEQQGTSTWCGEMSVSQQNVQWNRLPSSQRIY